MGIILITFIYKIELDLNGLKFDTFSVHFLHVMHFNITE